MLAAWLSSNLAPVPGELIAYGRRMALNAGKSEVLYTIEGRNSSVAITRWNDGAIEIDVNGHVEATTEPYDMKLQRMVGHLPGMLHPNGEIRARHRLRRRSQRRHLHPLSRHRAHHHLRNRARDPAHLHAAFSASTTTRSTRIPRRAWCSTMRATTC